MTRRIFAHHSDAASYAGDLARSHSASGRAAHVEYTQALRSAEGDGPAYVVQSCYGGRSDDYEVVELTPAELRDMVRAGMLHEADKCDSHAAESEAEVARLEASGTQRQRKDRLKQWAALDRTEAARLRVAAAGMGLVSATIADEVSEQRRAG